MQELRGEICTSASSVVTNVHGHGKEICTRELCTATKGYTNGISDAHANPDPSSDGRPADSVGVDTGVQQPARPRKVETDFYSQWTPTMEKTMQDIERKHGGPLYKRIEAEPLKLRVDAVPDVEAPEAAALYFKDLLEQRGCCGYYRVYNKTFYNGGMFVNFNFARDIGSMCPLCKMVHDGYTFTYKVKSGTYGGWKCWKADSEKGHDWETQYKFPDFKVLEK